MTADFGPEQKGSTLMGSALKRMQVAGLLAAAALALAACGSGSPKSSGSTGTGGGYGTLPGPHGTPVMGGTVSIAEAPGGGPTYIFPITPSANTSVGTITGFQAYMWRPLWWSPLGAQPAIDYSQSMAGPPALTDHNKVATITLKSGWKWSDGQPVTSKDVAFFIYVAKAAVAISPANYGSFTPGEFPQDVVSVKTPTPLTVIVTLSKSFNQNYQYLSQLGGIVPLPAHAWSKTSDGGKIIDFTNPANAKAIYKYLNAASSKLSTYGSNPLWQVVDGPYKIKSFDPSTDGNVLVANYKYSGPVKPHIAEIDNVAFTSTAAEFNQLLTKNLSVGFVDFSNLPQVAKLKSLGYNVWGYPDFGFNYIIYNFKDKTGDFRNIIAQLYIRQALAHLQDETGVIQSKGLFNGAAGPAYGPVPAIPKSPFAPANALRNPYPFSISTASSLLSSHGWKVVPNGTTTCVQPGTKSNECGAGIPAGTPLSWNLIYSNQPDVIGTQCEAFASNAKKIGINISLSAKTFNYITQNLADNANPSNDNVWAMQDFGGFTNSIYPTTQGIFNTTGGFNTGGWADKTADRLINASLYSTNGKAINAELTYITAEQPGLFQPNPDQITAFINTLAGPSASFAASSQFQFEPEYWYFTKH